MAPLSSGTQGRRSPLRLFLQTLVHQCSWVQHVALGVEQLGEILRHGGSRSHVGQAGTDGHHLGDLLLHLADLPVLLDDFICRQRSETEVRSPSSLQLHHLCTATPDMTGSTITFFFLAPPSSRYKAATECDVYWSLERNVLIGVNLHTNFKEFIELKTLWVLFGPEHKDCLCWLHRHRRKFNSKQMCILVVLGVKLEFSTSWFTELEKYDFQ